MPISSKALKLVNDCKIKKSKSLNLTECQLSEIPKEIADFVWLEKLNLAENQISRIDGLEKLVNISYLSLYRNRIKKIEGLEKLTNIEELVLYNNNISRIEGLENLIKISILSISSNQIQEIEGLEKLTNIKRLFLHRNKISKIEGLEKLTQISYLDLNVNKISRIEGLEKLANITTLVISNNQISKIEGLEMLVNITVLILANNNISAIEGVSIEMLERLEAIDLRYNPIQNLPSDELHNKRAILGYLKSIKSDTPVINMHLKLNIIGEGRIGKTQLFNFFRGNPYIANDTETHGTNTATYKIPNTEFEATIWDFGGQSYHHGFHKIFLGRTDFNLVLWRNDARQKPDYGYWLGTSRAFTSDVADGKYVYPLLLVQNVWQSNDITTSKDFVADIIHYPGSEQMQRYQTGIDDVFIIDVKEIFNEKDVWQLKHRYFMEQLHQKMIVHAKRLVIPEKWITIKKKLDESPIQEVNVKKDDFRRTYAADIRDYDKFEGLLAYLVFTGNILRFRENVKLKNYIFPNPPYLSGWLYNTVLDDGFKKKNDGKISLKQLKVKLQSGEKATIFIELMLGFELIFEQPHFTDGDDKGDTYYIIPQFLPEYKHSFKQVLLELLVFTFSLQFPDFVHEATIFRFIANYSEFAKDHTAYWKYGLLYGHEIHTENKNKTEEQKLKDTLQVIVYYIPEKRQLMVHIEDKKGRSEAAREIFDYFVFDIKQSVVESKKTSTQVGKKPIEELVEHQDLKESSIFSGKQRTVKDLKSIIYLSTKAPYFFDVAETMQNIEANNFYCINVETKQRMRLDFMAINLLSSDDNRKLRIFFSYSHKDEVYRNELEAHFAMLKRSGRIETWNDRKIIAGEVWDDKIKEQLNQADIVLLMISADFLNSDYIWEHELGIVRERYNKKDGIKVIPIFTRPCDTKDLDFMELQGAQKDNQRILPWISSSTDRDDTYMKMIEEIRNAMDLMK